MQLQEAYQTVTWDIVCVTDGLADRVTANLISIPCLSTAAFISEAASFMDGKRDRGIREACLRSPLEVCVGRCLLLSGRVQVRQAWREGATWIIYRLDWLNGIDYNRNDIKCRITLNAVSLQLKKWPRTDTNCVNYQFSFNPNINQSVRFHFIVVFFLSSLFVLFILCSENAHRCQHGLKHDYS